MKAKSRCGLIFEIKNLTYLFGSISAIWEDPYGGYVVIKLFATLIKYFQDFCLNLKNASSEMISTFRLSDALIDTNGLLHNIKCMFVDIQQFLEVRR